MPADQLDQALAGDDIETLRPLLPVGYTATAESLRQAALSLSAQDLTEHYSEGLNFFHGALVPHVKMILHDLSGGAWDFTEYMAYAAGSDVDFMSHVVEAAQQDHPVAIYPGDWYGFKVGASRPERVVFTPDSAGAMACLCVPSVRNGHLTAPMLEFLDSAETCLLNINLYPTLAPEERRTVAEALRPVLCKSVVSISFSRGFALTASQLGVILVHPEHPFRRRYEKQWNWFSYFHNALAARAFMNLDHTVLQTVDRARRRWTTEWLAARGLPDTGSGTYYVRSFQPEGTLAPRLRPLCRDGLVRICLKPPIAGPPGTPVVSI